MRIYVNGKLEMESLADTKLEEFKSDINRMLAKGLILERIEVGNGTYYDDVFEHVDNGYQDDKEITVYFRNLEIHLEDVMFTTHEYLERAIPLIETLGESFYGKEDDMKWSLLNEFVEGLGFVKDVVSAMYSANMIKEDNQSILAPASINKNITELTRAIQVKDYILIGDLIVYEFKPLYEEIFDQINKELQGGNR